MKKSHNHYFFYTTTLLWAEATILPSKKLIQSAIKEFNEHRVPEVEARLIKYHDSSFIVKFTGTFCQSCGFYDYFEDFRLLLENDFGVRTSIQQIEEITAGADVEFVFGT